MLKRKNRNSGQNRSTYFLINGLFLLLLLILFAWIAFSPVDVQCVYAKHGAVCRTCGLTRAFRAVLSFDFHARQLQLPVFKIVYFFLVQALLRLALFFWLIRHEPGKKLVRLDVAFTIILFIWAFHELFPFL